jgi:hypothetical protein
MDIESVTRAIILILKEIQTDCEHKPQKIVGAVRPGTDLDGFDSILWITATTIIAEKLEVEIPNTMNIFFSDGGRRARTIDEAATLIHQLMKTKVAA